MDKFVANTFDERVFDCSMTLADVHSVLAPAFESIEDTPLQRFLVNGLFRTADPEIIQHSAISDWVEVLPEKMVRLVTKAVFYHTETVEGTSHMYQWEKFQVKE